MRLDIDTVKKILAGKNQKWLDKAERIADEMHCLREKQEQIKKACDIKIKELGEDCLKLQKACLHKATTYYPDASGGNDSETVCDVCGKRL